MHTCRKVPLIGRVVTNEFQSNPAARRVLIAVNPRAGAQDREEIVAEFCHRLVQRGFQPTSHTELDSLVAEAERSLAAGQLRAVVAAGGDGTIRLIAERTAAGTPLV